MPIDPETKKSKAIAFVTFSLPEHAVKAFQELDGTIFQVRLGRPGVRQRRATAKKKGL